ncbi:uncharacterized protein METZ01_LOCUS358357, partial [marine metagenome]
SENIREKYGNDLKESLIKFKNKLNESEINRLEKNPLRILDSKNKDTQKIVSNNAPNIFDYISNKDNEHFNKVTNILDELKIPYTHDQKLVRGLDYYTKTVFELISSDLGGQDALCGGGRYDNLVQELGGQNIPAIGFAAGMERLILAMNLENNENINTDIYIINVESIYIPKAMQLADLLRKELGVAVYVDSLRRSIKSQMRHANKMNAKFSVIFDVENLNQDKIFIKNMNENKQDTILIDNIISYFESE